MSLPPFFGLRSEDQLQRQLDLARAAIAQWIAICHIRRARNGTEAGAVDRYIGQGEVRMVQDIEELRAELQMETFVDACRLDDRQICAVVPWADHGIAPCIAEGSGRRGRKRGRVEPRIPTLRALVGIAHGIRPVITRFAASAGRSTVPEWRDRDPAADAIDATHFPPVG